MILAALSRSNDGWIQSSHIDTQKKKNKKIKQKLVQGIQYHKTATTTAVTKHQTNNM